MSDMAEEIEKHPEDKNLYVYKILREQILSGIIPPGTKIKQKELAQQLSVSRTPINSALHKLESDGLVDKVPNVGFFVHKMNIKELLDVFALWMGLNIAALNQVRERDIRSEDVDLLKTTMIQYTNGEIDPNEYQKSNFKFHELLLQMSSNHLVAKINEQFQIFTRVSLGGILRAPEETLPEHLAIIQALEERRLDDLCRLIQEHEVRGYQVLADLVNKLQDLNLQIDKLYVHDVFPAKNLKELKDFQNQD